MPFIFYISTALILSALAGLVWLDHYALRQYRKCRYELSPFDILIMRELDRGRPMSVCKLLKRLNMPRLKDAFKLSLKHLVERELVQRSTAAASLVRPGRELTPLIVYQCTPIGAGLLHLQDAEPSSREDVG